MGQALTSDPTRMSALSSLRCSAIWNERDRDERARLLPSVSHLLAPAMSEVDNSLYPAHRDVILKGLGTALALVVPSGFSEQDRKLWLAVALETLKDIPLDLLQRGVIHARRVADHPAKIVPAIVQEVEVEWNRRRHAKAEIERLLALAAAPAAEQPKLTAPPLTADEIRRMGPDLRRIGLEQGFLTQEEIDATEVSE